jgi:hypothetical protein
MANQVHAFKDRDIQRVIKAARSAGLDPVEVEVDPRTGKIKAISKAAVAASEQNSLDNWLAKKQHARDAQGH